MPDRQDDADLSDWRALTPAQRNALAWRLARQAQAARARAIGEAVRATVRRLIGRLTSAFALAGTPASARR
jgi:hypothetical protein